jgi:hypothetical protein
MHFRQKTGHPCQRIKAEGSRRDYCDMAIGVLPVAVVVGGVNPSLTTQAIGLHTADRIKKLAMRGEL